MKAKPPAPAAAKASSDVVMPVQFRIPRSVHAGYKAACAIRGVSMTDDLVAYMRTAGSPPAAGRRVGRPTQ